MARPENLIPGNCYFSVHFYDNDLVLPMIDTLIYVGQEHDEEHQRLWLFKEPESQPPPDEPDALSEPSELIAFSDKQIHGIVDFEGLILRLREVAVEHPVTAIGQGSAERASVEDFASLSSEVENFLNDPNIVSLTITIRFTDDGLSLDREKNGYGMSFYTHPRRDPDEDSRILSLFAGLGIKPRVDHLFDRGRTRTLQFAIASGLTEIVDLCKRVLTEVHSMRRGDVLDYYPLRESDIQTKPTGRHGQAK